MTCVYDIHACMHVCIRVLRMYMHACIIASMHTYLNALHTCQRYIYNLMCLHYIHACITYANVHACIYDITHTKTYCCTCTNACMETLQARLFAYVNEQYIYACMNHKLLFTKHIFPHTCIHARMHAYTQNTADLCALHKYIRTCMHAYLHKLH